MRFYLSFMRIYLNVSKGHFRKVEHTDSDRAQFFNISVFVNNLLPPPSFHDLVLISTFIVLSQSPIRGLSVKSCSKPRPAYGYYTLHVQIFK